MQTAVDLFASRVAASGPRVALRHKTGGAWRALTWSDWDRAAREIGAGLRALGVEPGDRVCLLAGTCVEWLLCDVGVLMAGAVPVPIYQSNTAAECEYIINDCGAKVVIVEDAGQLAKLVQEKGKLAAVKRVVVMSGDAPAEPEGWVGSLAALRAGARPGGAEPPAVGPDSIFTIVYTSGTTGPPKGVVLTHGNIVFECDAVRDLLGLGEEDEQVLFLPLAHIFARILEWTSISLGIKTAIAEGIPQLIDNMKEIKPTFLGAVPRVYEKAYAKIQAGFAEKRKKAVARVLIDWALSVGRRRSAEEQAGRRARGLLAVQWRLADRLVFSKIRQTFGGRLRLFISGGAPLAKEIAEFFHTAGLLILEGYGLTETTAATHLNTPVAYRFGTVGRALPGVNIRIADDGEILSRGRNILQGYFGKPEATREAISPDGWFHTGDIGAIEDGFLRITDRKKDIIVTAGGKNIAPQNLENSLKARCPYISQVMVHGDKRNFLSALITLSEEGVAAGVEANAIVQRAVDGLNATLASYETIKKFAILPRDLSQEAGELTPTLKLKRKLVSQKYKDLLDGFYIENP